MSPEKDSDVKRMRLRYAGRYRACDARVAAGTHAVYFRATKQVECSPCHDSQGKVAPLDMAATVAFDVAEQVDIGVAGASARREYERRMTNRQQRVRTAHPTVGGLLLAITDEKQSTRAWGVGARGEELLAARLYSLTRHGVLLLHDRRIPGSRANIDHIAITTAGVFVIDAKRYKGRPWRKVDRGILRARTETLMVGRRDCTKLLTGVNKQADHVHTGLSKVPGVLDVPLRGILCFVDADWPMFGGSFAMSNVDVLRPAKLVDKLKVAGPLTAERAADLHRHLARWFPVA